MGRSIKHRLINKKPLVPRCPCGDGYDTDGDGKCPSCEARANMVGPQPGDLWRNSTNNLVYEVLHLGVYTATQTSIVVYRSYPAAIWSMVHVSPLDSWQSKRAGSVIGDFKAGDALLAASEPWFTFVGVKPK